MGVQVRERKTVKFAAQVIAQIPADTVGHSIVAQGERLLDDGGCQGDDGNQKDLLKYHLRGYEARPQHTVDSIAA